MRFLESRDEEDGSFLVGGSREASNVVKMDLGGGGGEPNLAIVPHRCGLGVGAGSHALL